MSWTSCRAVLLPVLAVLGLVLSNTALAQSIQLKFQPDEVLEGKTANLVLSVVGKSRLTPPKLHVPPGLKLSSPHPTMRSLNFNGKISSELIWLVTAEKAGKHRVVAANVRGVGTPPPAFLTVLDQGNLPPNKYGVPPGTNAFGSISFAKTNLVSREVVKCTVKIFVKNTGVTSVSVDFPKSIQLQSMRGRGVGSMSEAEAPRAEMVSGHRYFVSTFVVKTWPKQPGTFSVQPDMTLKILRRPDRFGFKSTYKEEVIKPVKPVVLKVRKFPEEGRPDSFTEAVGDFIFNTMIANTKSECKVGEPITLRYEINSENAVLDSVQSPRLLDETGFKVYRPRLEEFTPGMSGIGGRKIYEQIIEPTTTDVKQVPRIAFSYYDPAKDGYQEIVRGPYHFKVFPSDEPVYSPEQITALTPPAPTPTTTDTPKTGDPEVGSKPGTSSSAKNPAAPVVTPPAAPGGLLNALLPGGLTHDQADQFFYPSRQVKSWTRTDHVPFYLRVRELASTKVFPFLKGQALPFFALGFCFLLARRRRKTRGDVARARRKNAPKAARAGLAAASRAKEPRAFYEGVGQALTEYFGNRLNLQPGEVSSARVERAFPDNADEIASIFKATESSRYGGQANADIKAELRRLKGLIRHCEKTKPVL